MYDTLKYFCSKVMLRIFLSFMYSILVAMLFVFISVCFSLYTTFQTCTGDSKIFNLSMMEYLASSRVVLPIAILILGTLLSAVVMAVVKVRKGFPTVKKFTNYLLVTSIVAGSIVAIAFSGMVYLNQVIDKGRPSIDHIIIEETLFIILMALGGMCNISLISKSVYKLVQAFRALKRSLIKRKD